MQAPVAEHVVVREHRIGLVGMEHVFLDTEIGHPGVEVQGRAHAHRRQIGGAVEAGAHLMQRGKIGQPAHMRDAAGMDNGGADVVDQLLLDQVLAVPERIEHLAHRQRRYRVLANHFERALVFRRGGVLQPEQAVRLQVATQARSFDRCEAVMRIVQQFDLIAVVGAQLLEQLRHHPR